MARWILALTGALTLACGGNDLADTEFADASADAEGSAAADANVPDLSAPDPNSACGAQPPATCGTARTAEETRESLAILCSLDQSLHEMVACGQLTFGLLSALIDVVVQLFQDPAGIRPHPAYTFDGAGNYVTGSNTSGRTSMAVQFTYGAEYAVGGPDDLVTHDLFSANSYLVGARAELDLRRGRATVRYREPGPLVELLGLGATPPNPIEVGLNDADRLSRGLLNLQMQANITQTDEQGAARIAYTTRTTPATVGSTLSSDLMSYELVNIEGTRGAQSLGLEAWSVTYGNGGLGTLNGTADFRLTGGPFDYTVRFTYANTGWATASLTCP